MLGDSVSVTAITRKRVAPGPDCMMVDRILGAPGQFRLDPRRRLYFSP